MITELDKFLKREGISSKIKVDHPRRVKRGETKKEREKRYKENLKDLIKFNKMIMTLSPYTDKIEILDMYNLGKIIPETPIDLDEILLDGIEYYNETGNIRYKITELTKNAILKATTCNLTGF